MLMMMVLKIRDKISYIRMILSRLGNTITVKDRKKIKKELYEIEKKKNLSDKEKKEIYDNLVVLVRTLNKKEKYKYHDRDDLDYHGIRDIENLFKRLLKIIAFAYIYQLAKFDDLMSCDSVDIFRNAPCLMH